jgi:hypothetical protein
MALRWNEAGLDEMLSGIVHRVLEPRAKAIADACNEQSAAAGDHVGEYQGKSTTDEEKRGYRAGTEGGKPLEKHDYRATVITATYPAMADNARHNRMVENFHLAEGNNRER